VLALIVGERYVDRPLLSLSPHLQLAHKSQGILPGFLKNKIPVQQKKAIKKENSPKQALQKRKNT
jgi:hypothetical protein